MLLDKNEPPIAKIDNPAMPISFDEFETMAGAKISICKPTIEPRQ